MPGGAAPDSWRYGVASTGAAGVLALATFASVGGQSAFRTLTASALPALVFLAVLAYGVRLARHESPAHVRTVTGVAVAVAIGYVALTAWFYALVAHDHGFLDGGESTYLAFGTAGVGLAFGAVATHQYVRQREQARSLRAANDRLREQNDRLDEFASILSHDLRNPLTVARGYVEIYEQTGDDAHLEEVKACHDRIETLVDQVLDLARMDRDPDAVAPVEVAGVATDALETVAVGAGEVVVDVDCTVAVERGDLRRVFENCYRNSVEHAGPAPTITVRTLEDAAGFAIEDDGPGIPVDEREAVRERGYSSGDGTGLGLAIVHEIADTYGWTVRITEGRAGGACLEFHTAGSSADVDGPDRDDDAAGTGRGDGVDAVPSPSP